jgi:hypothetical protein
MNVSIADISVPFRSDPAQPSGSHRTVFLLRATSAANKPKQPTGQSDERRERRKSLTLIREKTIGGKMVARNVEGISTLVDDSEQSVSPEAAVQGRSTERRTEAGASIAANKMS